ncbi:unnamed protein product [Diamesa tonsa]
MEYSNSYDEIKDRRVNNLVLNSSYQSYTSNHVQKQLQNLDQLNRRSQSRTGGLFGSTDQINFDQNSLLVVALTHMKYMYIKNQVIADDGTEQTEVVDIKPSKTNEELVDPEELEKSLLETTDEFLHHEPLTNSTPKSHRVRLLSPRDEMIQPQFYESGVNEVADNNSRVDGNESNDNQLANVPESSDNAPELTIDVPESSDNDAEPSKE